MHTFTVTLLRGIFGFINTLHNPTVHIIVNQICNCSQILSTKDAVAKRSAKYLFFRNNIIWKSII